MNQKFYNYYIKLVHDMYISNLHRVQLIQCSEEDVVFGTLHDVHMLYFPHQQRHSYQLKCSRYLEWDDRYIVVFHEAGP